MTFSSYSLVQAQCFNSDFINLKMYKIRIEAFLLRQAIRIQISARVNHSYFQSYNNSWQCISKCNQQIVRHRIAATTLTYKHLIVDKTYIRQSKLVLQCLRCGYPALTVTLLVLQQKIRASNLLHCGYQFCRSSQQLAPNPPTLGKPYMGQWLQKQSVAQAESS